MITDYLLAFIQGGLTLLLSPFPTGGSDVWEHVDLIASNLGAMNYFLPIAETFTLVVAVMALFPVFLGITLSLWVIAQLRGSSSVG